MPDQDFPKDTSADGTTGQVILVGGDPGADDLITVRGLDRLPAADVRIEPGQPYPERLPAC